MSLDYVTINGRKHYSFNRITSVKKIAAGKYVIETKWNGTFTVEGGRKRGGTRGQWFLECEAWNKPIDCTSVSDACNIIETM